MAKKIDFGTLAVSTAASVVVSRQVNKALTDSDSAESGSGGETTQTTADTQAQPERRTDGGETAAKLDELLDHRRNLEPSPDDVDAWASETIDLPAGSLAKVTVTPKRGFYLRVERAEFDRRADHVYTFNAGGETFSANHKYDPTRPKRITQGGKLVATALNDSGTASEIDFEFAGWAESI